MRSNIHGVELQIQQVYPLDRMIGIGKILPYRNVTLPSFIHKSIIGENYYSNIMPC